MTIEALMRIILEKIVTGRRNLWEYWSARPSLQYLLIVMILLRFGFLLTMLGQHSLVEMYSLAPDSIRYTDIARGFVGAAPFDENSVLIFGPGYGFFLAVIFILFGVNSIAVLIIQNCLSCASGILLYELAKDLSGSKRVGLIAGYLYAFSFTSISLTNMILSDSVFFFFFLAGNVLFLKSARSGKWGHIIVSGLFIGYAVLIRTIGQFWPLIMLMYSLFYIFKYRQTQSAKNRFLLSGKLAVAPLIAILIISTWVVRNYVRYDYPVLAMTSSGGSANVATLAISSVEGKSVDEIRRQWADTYRQKTGRSPNGLVDQYILFKYEAQECWRKYPYQMVKEYLKLVWENVTAVNEFYRVQMPKYLIPIMDSMYWYRGHSYHYLNFWLSICGFIAMALYRKWRLLIVGVLIFFYYIAMMGFTHWQGSRLFYPGQIASFISIAYLIVVLSKRGGKIVKYFGHIGKEIYKGVINRRSGDDSASQLRMTD